MTFYYSYVPAPGAPKSPEPMAPLPMPAKPEAPHQHPPVFDPAMKPETPEVPKHEQAPAKIIESASAPEPVEPEPAKS